MEAGTAGTTTSKDFLNDLATTLTQRKNAIDDRLKEIKTERAALDNEWTALTQEQGRIRDGLKALKGKK